MTRSFWPRLGLTAIALMGMVAAPGRAQTTTNFVIRGPVAAVNWRNGLEGPVNVDLTLFAFTDVAPAVGDQPAPGPRLVFSVTRLAALGGTLIRRQWYGSAALPAGALVIAPDLSTATLDAEVEGTFEERVENGEPTRKVVKGRIQGSWVASEGPANTTLSVNNQEAPFPMQFNSAGQGRRAVMTATVTADGLGGVIQGIGSGNLLSPAAGVFTLGPQ
jgi:hypothetical protein